MRIGSQRGRALLAFAGFGLFWGSWGAQLPAVQSHAGVSDGALGVALLCIGAGALASMRPTGALIDRHGPHVLPLTVAVFAGCAILPALATSAPALGLALLALGAASGAVDVAINAEGTGAEAAGRPLMNLAHAAFSATVVVASVLAGVLRSAGAGPVLGLGLVAVALLALAGTLALMPGAAAMPAHERGPRASIFSLSRPLAIIGTLCAVAFLVENAWQSWSAVHLETTLDASPAVAALGPALFGAFAAIGRLGGHRVQEHVHDSLLIGIGAAIGGAGTLLGALAPSAPVALAGIALAGLGTSVCAPTLLGLAGRVARPAERGMAVSAVTTLAYFGFLLGPAIVGLAAQASSLRAALTGVAVVALGLALAARAAPRAPRDASLVQSAP